MSFDALVRSLSELEGLMKSLEASQADGANNDDDEEEDDDRLIADAAADSGDAGEGVDDADDSDDLDAEDLGTDDDDDDDVDEDDSDDDEDDEDDEDDDLFGKSFAVRTADGNVVRAVDGVAVISRLRNEIRGQNEELARSLVALTKVVKKQAQMIKSLRMDLAAKAASGRGRKAVLTVHEKPAAGRQMAKSQRAEISGEEFLLKAIDAQRNGRITGVEVAIAEAAINNRQQVPDHIVKKVLG